MAFAILSDVDGLWRHSPVLGTPKPLALSGPAGALDLQTRFWRRDSAEPRAKIIHSTQNAEATAL
jgi:hypothetical protein